VVADAKGLAEDWADSQNRQERVKYPKLTIWVDISRIASSKSTYDYLSKTSRVSAPCETAPHSSVRSEKVRVARNDECAAEQGETCGDESR
jgi:hypothetical protein